MPAYSSFTGGSWPCSGRSNAGSAMWMESKKPFGQAVSLAGSSTTASPSCRTETVAGKWTLLGRRTIWRPPSTMTEAVSIWGSLCHRPGEAKPEIAFREPGSPLGQGKRAKLWSDLSSSSPRRFGGLLPGTGLFVPGPPHNRATPRALPGRSPDVNQAPLGVTPKLAESRQNVPIETLGQVWQDRAAMNGSEEFFFTRVASSTSGRARNQIPTSRELERLRSRVEQVYESNSGGVEV
jgi:hypothetical protein